MNSIIRYVVVAAAILGGLYTIHLHQPAWLIAGLFGLAGLLADPADVMAVIEKAVQWKRGA